MPKIFDASGALVEIPVDLSTYKEAEKRNLSVKQYINQTYPTSTAHGPAFDQVLASEGIFFKNDPANGIRATRMGAIMDGTSSMGAGAITRDGTPSSRIIWPAAILSAIENSLQTDFNMSADAFEQMIAISDSIPGDKFDRPVLNYSGPQGARSQGIAQLAMPNTMLQITVSDLSRRIPTRSLGLEVSDQATANVSIDLIALAIARQAAAERGERADEYLRSFLIGDADVGMVALSTISNKVVNAVTLDSTLSTAGVLSQKAWMAWLIKNGRKRKITHVVTDLAGALAIENRTGKPVITTDDPTSARINTLHNVMNKTWGDNVQVYITEDTAWPANTIMGLDNSSAIGRVQSLSASYSAVEAFTLKRSTGFRIDTGEVVYRLFDDAFECLTLL